MPQSRFLLGILALAAASAATAGDRVLLNIDFENKPVDQLMGTAGPGADEPVANDSGYVRLAPFGSAHLEIVDDSACCARRTRFEFPGAEEIHSGTLQISAQVYFPAAVHANIVMLRENFSSAASFLDFYTGQLLNPAGNGWLNAYAGNTYSGSLTQPGYPIGRWVTMRTAYSPDQKRVRLFLDDLPIWERENFDLDTTRGVGAVLVGSHDTGAATGSVMRMDDLRVVHCDSAVFDDCLLVDDFGE